MDWKHARTEIRQRRFAVTKDYFHKTMKIPGKITPAKNELRKLIHSQEIWTSKSKQNDEKSNNKNIKSIICIKFEKF
jgi:hypothetical protein